MKHIISIISFVLSCTLSVQATTLSEQADSAYMRDDFATAAALYQQIITEEGTSSDLYYNLGNAYYRQGMLGKAIVYYERALKLNPTNKEALSNLAFVNSKITDIPGDKGTFISNTFNNIASKLHSNTWATIAIVSFIMLLVGIAMYVFSSNIAIRKSGFFGALILLVATIITNVFAYMSALRSTSDNEAIIITPSTLLSTSPREPKDRSEEAMLLHEGTKVEILDSVKNGIDSSAIIWYDVQVDNTHRAWIKSSAVEKI